MLPQKNSLLHFQKIVEPDFSAHQLLMLAYITCNELGWQVNYFAHAGIIANTKNMSNEIHFFVGQGTVEIAIYDSYSSATYLKNKTLHSFIDKWDEIKPAYSQEILQKKYDEIADHLLPLAQEIKLIRPQIQTTSLSSDLLSLILPHEGYFFTPIIILLNLLVFVGMWIDGGSLTAPGSKVLIEWGANYTPLTRGGQWWRLLTSCFVHIGAVHLLMNMFAFIFVSIIVEPLVGRWKFLFLYITSGIVGSLISLWWHNITISAGASGAIFGMYGVYLILLTTPFVEKTSRKKLLISVLIFIAFNLAGGMKEGIDNAAHTGGLISGIVLTFLLLPSIKKWNSRHL